ncbi:hypothetical protein ACHAXR_000705, partial [Thalassiosira sp. AJA248-18]
MVSEILRLRHLDFTPLLHPRLNYQDQTKISNNRVDMATAAMIHYDMNPGMVVRFMSGEYTGETRDVQAIVKEIEQHVDPSDLAHIIRILTQGCPSVLDFEEDSSNKLDLISRGN